MKYRVSTFRNRQSKSDHTDQVPVAEIVNNIEDLAALQKTVAWSPVLYANNRRLTENCRSAQLIVLDFDGSELIMASGDVKPPGSFKKFKDLLNFFEEECLVTFTESHRGIKNGKEQEDCFRATFFLKEECFDMIQYKATLQSYIDKYREAGVEDNANINQYFWASTGRHSETQTYFKGKKALLTKVKKQSKEDSKTLKTDLSKIPLYSEFLKMNEAELESRRNEIVNKLSYILASHGYTDQEVKDIIFSKPLERPLDFRYERIIEDACISGKELYESRRLQFGEKFFKTMAVEAFFEEFLLTYDVTCSYQGMVSIGDKAFPDDMIVDYMVVASSKCQLKNKSRDTLRALLNVWKVDQIQISMKNMTASIEFVEPNNEICKFVEAVTGTLHPLDIAVMRHWVWQIKRKFKKMETKHHIMPILYGKTRSGKTTAIERLIRPIKELTMIAELAMVNDSRNDFNLIEKLVIFFDELGKAEKVVVSNLKQKITSSTITYRRLGSNQNTSGFNMCSFIGATNEPVVDAIVDPTSARRFYEMKTLDKCNWKLINQIDFLKIWQSVNELEETAPIEEHLFALSESQEDIRAKDYVEEFVAEYSLIPRESEEAKFVSTMELYLKLKMWLETQNKGMYIPSISKFSRRLKNFIDKAPVTAVNGSALNGFYVAGSYSGKIVIQSKEISLGN